MKKLAYFNKMFLLPVALVVVVLTVALLAVTGEVLPGTLAQESPEERVIRHAGDDRYETSAKVALEAYPDGAPEVIIARGDDDGEWADGLAASYMAGLLDAPVLLSRPEGLPGVIKETIAMLEPDFVYVLGGRDALSSQVDSDVIELGFEPGDQAARVRGEDRYDTAATIAFHGKNLWDNVTDRAFITGGYAPADSMVAGAVSHRLQDPVLLVNRDFVPETTKEMLGELGIERLYVVGGESVVSAEVYDQLAGMVDQIDRLAGKDRFLTSLELAREFAEDDSFSIVGGYNLADAVGAASFEKPILYMDSDKVPAELEEYIRDRAGDNTVFSIFGGNLAVPEIVENDLLAILEDKLQQKPVIETVEVINRKEVEISFNQPMDEATALDPQNYIFTRMQKDNLKGPAAAASFAGDDRTTVRLATAGTGEKDRFSALDSVAGLQISGVYTEEGSYYYQSPPELETLGPVPEDAGDPAVEKVVPLGERHFKLVFSEAVIAGAESSAHSALNPQSYRVDEKQLSGSGDREVVISNPSKDLRTFLFAFPETAGDIVPLQGDVQVEVNQAVTGDEEIRDFAGNPVAEFSQTKEFSADEVRPEVDKVTVVDRQQVLLEFSELIDEEELAEEKIKWGRDDYEAAEGSAAGLSYLSGNLYRLKFEKEEALPEEGDYRLWIPQSEVVDFSGNQMAEDYEKTLSGRENPEMIISFDPALSAPDRLSFNFSRDLATGAVNTARDKYRLNGESLGTGDQVSLEGSRKVVIDLEEDLSYGENEVSFRELEDVFAEVIPNQRVRFRTVDPDKPVVENAWYAGEIYDVAAEEKKAVLILEFDKKMPAGDASGSIEARDHYRLAQEEGGEKETLPAGAELAAFSEDARVKISWPLEEQSLEADDLLYAGYTEAGSYRGITDLAGNPFGLDAVTGFDAREELNFAEAAGQIVDESTVILDIDGIRNGFGRVDSADFSALRNETNEVTVKQASLSDQRGDGIYDRLTLNFPTGTFEAGDTVEINLEESAGSTDLFGAALGEATNLVTENPIQVQLIRASLVDQETVRFIFNHEIAYLNETDFKLEYEDNEYRLEVDSAQVYSGEKAIQDVTVQESLPVYAEPVIGPAVPEDMLQTEDVDGQKLKMPVEVETDNFRVYEIDWYHLGDNDEVLDGDRLTITFHGAVDPESIFTGWDGNVDQTLSAGDDFGFESEASSGDNDAIVFRGDASNLGMLDLGSTDVVEGTVAPDEDAVLSLSGDGKTVSVDFGDESENEELTAGEIDLLRYEPTSHITDEAGRRYLNASHRPTRISGFAGMLYLPELE